jgi:hypothetical protein
MKKASQQPKQRMLTLILSQILLWDNSIISYIKSLSNNIWLSQFSKFKNFFGGHKLLRVELNYFTTNGKCRENIIKMCICSMNTKIMSCKNNSSTISEERKVQKQSWKLHIRMICRQELWHLFSSHQCQLLHSHFVN